MLKEDIAHFRRNLKLDNDVLSLQDLCNIYVTKNSNEIYYKQKVPFALLDREEQELFLFNFKKALTGQLDQKLFPLRFKQIDGEYRIRTQTLLYENLTSNSDEWANSVETIVEQLIEKEQYDTDIVFTFARGIYRCPEKREVSDDAETSYVSPFTFCTINETKMPNNELLFDYIEKEFTYHIEVNPVINLKAPKSSFLFPTFEHGPNVNHILYTTRKAYALDHHLLDEVLQVEDTSTAEDDKLIFNEVVKRVAGEQLNTEKLSYLYEEVHERIIDQEEDEQLKVDYREVSSLLTQSGLQGIETEDVKEAFEAVVQDPAYELKAESIIPKFTTKSLKIKTKVVNFSLRPKDLQYVRQVNIDGKRCLVIEVDESMEVDGFSLIPEANLTERNEVNK